MSKNTFASAIPPIAAFGEWRTAGDDLWVEAAVAPSRGLFETLDNLGEDLPEAPLSLADEATAIFASCWRYGSYAHVLTQGAPLPEAIRKNPEMGRITDWEMRRIQIEFTAALAAWWEFEDTEPEKVRRRARAAREFLPMPKLSMLLPDEVTKKQFAGVARELQEKVAGDPDAEKALIKEWPVRLQANSTVSLIYRSGPIESLHAGARASLEAVPGWPQVRRLYAPDLRRIANWSVHRLMTHIAARRYWRQAGYSFLVGSGLRECAEWSVELETAPVCYRKPGAV